MLVEHGDEVLGKVALSLVGVRISIGIVVRSAAKLPLERVAYLYHHDILVGKIGLHAVDGRFECRERSVPARIVAQSDDIVVYIGISHPRVEILKHTRVGHPLRMEDNLGLWAHLTASLAACLSSVVKRSQLASLVE